MEITGLRFENGNADHVDKIWFFRIFSQKSPLYFFSPEELALLFLLKEVKPSPDHKTIKLLTFDTCFCYENP